MLADPPVDRLGHRGSVRLGVAVEHDQCGSVGMVAVEQSEQPVALPSLAATHLVDAGHLRVRRFPPVATGERRGGASRGLGCDLLLMHAG